MNEVSGEVQGQSSRTGLRKYCFEGIVLLKKIYFIFSTKFLLRVFLHYTFW